LITSESDTAVIYVATDRLRVTNDLDPIPRRRRAYYGGDKDALSMLEFSGFRSDVVGMDFVTVYTALNPADADLVRSRLEANDFFVNIKNEIAARTIDGFALAAGGLLVQVPEDQAESARELIHSKDP
jgi:hypothetical protein